MSQMLGLSLPAVSSIYIQFTTTVNHSYWFEILKNK